MKRPFQPGLLGGPTALPERPERETSPGPDRAIERAALLVSLDLEEQEWVGRVARRVAARYKRGHDEKGQPAAMQFTPRGASIDDVNLEGFGAELAVSIHLDLPWNEGKRGKPDVGNNVEVRQSVFDDAHLTIRSWDKLGRLFVLAVGHFPTYEMRGWILGSTGAGLAAYYPPLEPNEYRPGGEKVTSRTGTWRVPQAALRPMYELEVRR